MSQLGYAQPGMGTFVSSQSNQFTWGGTRHEVLELDFTISNAARDAGSNNTQILRPGLAMGIITASGKLAQFDLSASDGTENLVGFLKEETPLITLLGTAQDAFAPLLVKVPVKAKKILYKGVTIIGHADEYAIRDQIRRRFALDDEFGVYAEARSNVRHVRQRFTIAQVNAGATILPAVTGRKYRMIDVALISVGGAAGAVTTVDILGTQSASSVKLLAAAQANLTQNTLLRAGATGGTILAAGASFVQNDANTAITINKTGSDVTTATHIDVLLTYELGQ